jgi:moderate conductance mechanosensitive channel
MAMLAPLLAAVTVEEVEACGDQPGAACLFVFRRTGSDLLARSTDWLIARPLKVVLIVVIALVVNALAQRAISRFVESVERATVRRGIGPPSDPGSLLMTGPLGERAHQRAETIAVVLRSFAKVVIFGMASLMVLGAIAPDVNLGPLIAGAGIVGVAIGFGSQSLVRDFLSGMFMLIEDQFGVGDVIDAGEASGVVEGLSLRTTRLRDVEGTVWHIPNGEIRRVGNKSQEWSRALLDIEVAYDTDLDLAQDIIKRVADEVWGDQEWAGSVLGEPEVWGVEQLGASGIAIRLVVKTKPADQWKVMRVLRRRIKDAFDANGIEIPFPQQTVWYRNRKGAEGAALPLEES